jgi:hypothetical protein
VCGDGDAALRADLLKDIDEGFVGKIRRWIDIGYAELTQESAELILAGLGRIDAEDMNAFA